MLKKVQILSSNTSYRGVWVAYNLHSTLTYMDNYKTDKQPFSKLYDCFRPGPTAPFRTGLWIAL